MFAKNKSVTAKIMNLYIPSFAFLHDLHALHAEPEPKENHSKQLIWRPTW